MKPKAIPILAMGAILLSACPCPATYTIPVDAFTEGGGTGLAGQYEVTYATGQATPIVTSTAGTYTLSTGLLSAMLPDVMPPLLSHQPAGLVSAHTPLEIEVTVSDDKAGVDTVVLYYHEGGRTAWRTRNMQGAGGDLFSTTIPSAAVTEKGLAYYVEAADKAGNASRHPAGAPDSVISVRVWFTDLPSAVTLPSSRYRMISLPGVTNGDPDSVLVDDFGPYDRTVWRLGRWNAPDTGCAGYCYDEYPDIEDLDPGRAFWLITDQSKAFDFSGMSSDITGPSRVNLERGWNQIGTPFAFSTDWLSTEIEYDGSVFVLGAKHPVGADTVHVEAYLISYDGSYHDDELALAPWNGYWVRNAGTVEVDLLVYPQPASEALAEHLREPYGAGMMTALYSIKVGAEYLKEQVSRAGMSPFAADGWDAMDHRQPPPIGDYLRAVFLKSTWGRYSGTYMTDIRGACKEGAAWPFLVESSGLTDIALDIEPIIPGPETWDLVLYDTQSGMKLTSSEMPYRFSAQANRSFVLVAGTERFIETHETTSGINLRPQLVSVSPNPFTDAAEIAFFVPRRMPVRLAVFSVQGRLVTVLTDSRLDAGVHRLTWRGGSSEQSPVAPGIYFLQLDVPDRIETKKILLVR